jgi:N-acyl-D-aspartate/D-glutamate deacylase
MVTSAATLLGLADGGAHVAAISDSSQPTTFLTDWVRDRTLGDPNHILVECAVRKLTKANADAFGLIDRGAIQVGLKADLNIINMDALGVGDPEMVFDLPQGRPRLDQRASGYVANIVSGEVIVENGALTGALPGALVRASSLTR